MTPKKPYSEKVQKPSFLGNRKRTKEMLEGRIPIIDFHRWLDTNGLRYEDIACVFQISVAAMRDWETRGFVPVDVSQRLRSGETISRTISFEGNFPPEVKRA